VTATTATGPASPLTLLVDTASDVPLPANSSTSLLQGASATVSGSGHLVQFVGGSQAVNNGAVQVSVTVDGIAVYEDSAGTHFSFNTPLSAGPHVIEFIAYALNGSSAMNSASLIVTDLGL